MANIIKNVHSYVGPIVLDAVRKAVYSVSCITASKIIDMLMPFITQETWIS